MTTSRSKALREDADFKNIFKMFRSEVLKRNPFRQNAAYPALECIDSAQRASVILHDLNLINFKTSSQIDSVQTTHILICRIALSASAVVSVSELAVTNNTITITTASS